MPLLKAPPQQRKNVTLQVRIDEVLRDKLVEYADFLSSSESYVVSGALKLIFEKDREFRDWREQRTVTNRVRASGAAGEQVNAVTSTTVEQAEQRPVLVRDSANRPAQSNTKTEPQAMTLDFRHP